MDVPGAGTDPTLYEGTYATGITPEAAISGYYIDGNGSHGFLRVPNGTLTTFDPPGSTYTAPSGINPTGTITGNYSDASFNVHGFLRIPAHQENDTEGSGGND